MHEMRYGFANVVWHEASPLCPVVAGIHRAGSGVVAAGLPVVTLDMALVKDTRTRGRDRWGGTRSA